jgi:murein L,D-transpeptidase YcbB/YkuD
VFIKKTISIITLLTVLTLLALSDISHAETLTDQVRTQIINTIGGAERQAIIAPPGSQSLSPMIVQFYEERGFRPVWSDDFGPSPEAEDFLEVIRSAYHEGLNPDDYHLNKIETVLSDLYATEAGLEPCDVAKLAGLDLALTHAFFLYASHMVDGRVDHRNVYPDWVVNERYADLAAVLNYAIESKEMQKTLADLAPPYPRYAGLK